MRFAHVRHGDSVLDVGSGTGAVAAAVAAVSPSTRIVGIDSAAGFVEFARAGGDRIRFDVADAQQLPFADRTFSRTLSLLNLNFVPDPEKRSRKCHACRRREEPWLRLPFVLRARAWAVRATVPSGARVDHVKEAARRP